jgi:hypothetical protein
MRHWIFLTDFIISETLMPKNTLILLTAAVLMVATSPLSANCLGSIHPSTPNTQFKINADGTVLDKKTGLMWKRCKEAPIGGMACNKILYTTWGAALRMAADSVFAGYTDWRLPNVKELQSLVEESCAIPAINLAVFPKVYNGRNNDAVWSSSPAKSGYGAWHVHFLDGSSGYGDDHDCNNCMYAVWLVRGGQ